MVKAYDFFSGSQEDINRRLLRKILALEAKVGNTDISDLETDVEALKTAVGGESSGLVKDVGSLKTTVGDAEGGLVKGVADINTEIGDDNTPGTIKGRIKALEPEGSG